MILVSKVLGKGSTINILPWGTRIGIKTNILKVLVIHFKGLGVLLVGSNIQVIVLSKRMIVLVVVVNATR